MLKKTLRKVRKVKHHHHRGRDETRTQTTVSARFDINTGKAYINDQEVSSDEYVVGESIKARTNTTIWYKNMIESKSIMVLKLLMMKEEGTITYIVLSKDHLVEETSSGTNAETTKMSEGLILSGSGGESNNSL